MQHARSHKVFCTIKYTFLKDRKCTCINFTSHLELRSFCRTEAPIRRWVVKTRLLACWLRNHRWQALLLRQTARNRCWCAKNAPHSWCRRTILSYQYFLTARRMAPFVWRRTALGQCRTLNFTAGKFSNEDYVHSRTDFC